MLDWERLKARANGDGEFRIHARMWNGTIRLGIGGEKTRITITAGVIESAERWPGGGPSDLAITAATDEWNALLARVPRPFYQDLYPASVHHGFEITGDQEHYCAYYPAVRRLIELMREVNNG